MVDDRRSLRFVWRRRWLGRLRNGDRSYDMYMRAGAISIDYYRILTCKIWQWLLRGLRDQRDSGNARSRAWLCCASSRRGRFRGGGGQDREGATVAYQASVEDEGGADARRESGTHDEHERDRSVLDVFGWGSHPIFASPVSNYRGGLQSVQVNGVCAEPWYIFFRAGVLLSCWFVNGQRQDETRGGASRFLRSFL